MVDQFSDEIQVDFVSSIKKESFKQIQIGHTYVRYLSSAPATNEILFKPGFQSRPGVAYRICQCSETFPRENSVESFFVPYNRLYELLGGRLPCVPVVKGVATQFIPIHYCMQKVVSGRDASHFRF